MTTTMCVMGKTPGSLAQCIMFGVLCGVLVWVSILSIFLFLLPQSSSWREVILRDVRRHSNITKAILIVIGILCYGTYSAMSVYFFHRFGYLPSTAEEGWESRPNDNIFNLEARLSVVDIPEWGCPEIEEIHVGRELGRGVWREVRYGTWKGMEVAVKRPRKDLEGRHKQWYGGESMHKDVAIMRALRPHPNVVDFLGSCGETVVTEFLNTRLDYFLTKRARQLSAVQHVSLMLDATSAVAALHTVARTGVVVHGDLRMDQFFVKEVDTKDIDAMGVDPTFPYVVKLSDFNLCKLLLPGSLGDDKFCYRNEKPSKWRPPEEYRGEPLDQSMDVYRLSMVLWCMLSGTKPYPTLDTEQVPAYVTSGGRPDIPSRTPEDVANILRMMWADDPTDRPTSVEVYEMLRNVYVVLGGSARKYHDTVRDGSGIESRTLL
eukprot:Rmarinus@m.7783